MLNILTITPFGFVLELEQDGCFYTPQPYTLFVNGTTRLTGSDPVISLFGLKPDTEYQVEIHGLGEPAAATIRTERCGFAIHIKDYNAAGDGIRNDTAAIHAAIYSAPPHSVVIFPRGEYLVEHLFLKSGVDLYLEEGAVLRQNPNREALAIVKGYQKSYDYTDAVINASWEGNPLDCFCSLIYGKDVQQVRIYGGGILNGSGMEGGWWNEPKKKNRAYRPRNVSLVNCSEITVCGLTSQNSAAWNIHPLYSNNLSFYGLTIQSDPNSPNTDGLNPESCENVEIVGCRFQVGDDCIAIKSGKLFLSRRHLRPSRKITVRRCLMEEGHGGVVIGSEISCGVQDVLVENCLFRRTDRGFRIKTRRGRGSTSVVDGIRFSHVKMEQVSHCFVINMFYHCDPDGHSNLVQCKEALPAGPETPAVQNITLSDICADEIAGSAVFLYGLPESSIRNVTVKNSRFRFAEQRLLECPDLMDDPVLIPNLGVYAKNVQGLTFKNNQMEGTHVDKMEQEEKA